MTITDSILDTVKPMLGILVTDSGFDVDVITNINSALMNLNQFGITATPFQIEDNTATWADLTDDMSLYNLLKNYVFLFVKLAFDPPSSSFVLDSYSKQLDEQAWRLTAQVEVVNYVPPPPTSEE